MKDEIKEIKIDKNAKSIFFINNGIRFLQFGIADEILDLITNLQEENKKLKELCDKYEEEHRTTFEYWKQLVKEDYKSRCEKAIEYINTHYLNANEPELLNILQGEDK